MMRQWMLKITAYAERLLEDLDLLDWPDHVKEIQRHWIGRSEGARITFPSTAARESFEVFTTRPETLFGCTFCVLSPEHPLVGRIVAPDRRAARRGVPAPSGGQERARAHRPGRGRPGLRPGLRRHPITGVKVPVWIADYVLMSYASGSIMAVPGHDERDHAFARRYGLPIVRVIAGGERRSRRRRTAARA